MMCMWPNIIYLCLWP